MNRATLRRDNADPDPTKAAAAGAKILLRLSGTKKAVTVREPDVFIGDFGVRLVIGTESCKM
jgi:hypothetical protein